MTMKTPRLVFKIHTSKLADAGWELVMSIDEARRSDCLITLGDSQVLRWICDIRGLKNSGEVDLAAKAIRREIKELRRQPDSRENRKVIERLYQQLDKELIIEDYLCLVADSKSQFDRACKKKGVVLNGKKFVRLVGTSGGVKESTVVFVAADIAPELRRRIDNGRDMTKEMVPAKFEAYRGLTCSASLPVSMPHGVAVIPDCMTHFKSAVTYIDDSADGDPVMSEIPDMDIELDASDGCGLALPCLLERWGRELDVRYTPCALNTRMAWEKGIVVAFDFRRFAQEVAGRYIIKDVWGNEVDVRDVELLLTESMVKLWDSYESAEDYFAKSAENGYTFAVTKVAPEKLDEQRNLNLFKIGSVHSNVFAKLSIELLENPKADQATALNARAAKAEKIGRMAQGQILNAGIVGNQQPRPLRGKVQRLSRTGVRAQAIGALKRWTPTGVKI